MGLLILFPLRDDYRAGVAVVSAATTVVSTGASSITGVSSTTTVSSTVTSSVDLLPQEAVAIKPAIAKIANTFFIFCGFLNYRAKVLVLITIKQVPFKYFLFVLVDNFNRNPFEIKVFPQSIF